MPDDSSSVKIAVQMDGKQPILTVFDRRQPLDAHIASLASSWGLVEPVQQFALKFADRRDEKYITEKNKLEVRNGSVLRLEMAPSLRAAELARRVKEGSTVAAALDSLLELSGDVTFAEEFVAVDGLALVIAGVQDGSFGDRQLPAALCVFLELMEHGIVGWDVLQPKFLARVAGVVNNKVLADDGHAEEPAAKLRSASITTLTSSRANLNSSLGGGQESLSGRANSSSRKALKASLSILENVVVNSSAAELAGLVERDVTLPNLMHHLQNWDSTIQQNALALINALFQRADELKKKSMAASLNSKSYRTIISTHIVARRGGGDGHQEMGEELAHQLYVLQAQQLNMLESRTRRAADPQDADFQEQLRQLRKLAYGMDDQSSHHHAGSQPSRDSSGSGRRSTSSACSSLARDLQQLGFTDGAAPARDLQDMPPGLLALDCMLYVARNQADLFTRLVLENAGRTEHECPFARASVRLTGLLCQILRVGEQLSDQATGYYPMFFAQDRPFEECFCIGIGLLNKTWKEMRATGEDLDKVMSVVQEQLTRALLGRQKPGEGGGKHEPLTRPDPPASLDAFRARLNALTYSQINSIRQQEQNSKEEWESQARPVLELREQLKPDMLQLVQMQRLQYLVDGTRFTKYTPRGQRTKDKYTYMRLSPNHKFVHYGDCTEQSSPSHDELSHKLPVAELKQLLVGRDCPHMKDSKGKKWTFQLAFSLMLDSPDAGSLDFVAPDEKTFDYWTDGFNALLDKPMTSAEAGRDLEMLLAMEIKLRLLDTDGLDIPQEPPPIPPDPPNYNFCCN